MECFDGAEQVDSESDAEHPELLPDSDFGFELLDEDHHESAQTIDSTLAAPRCDRSLFNSPSEVESAQLDDDRPSVNVPVSCLVASAADWNLAVLTSFSQFRSDPVALILLWETGVQAASFGRQDRLSMPLCKGLAQDAPTSREELAAVPAGAPQTEGLQDAKYLQAVQLLKDIAYFEEKSQKPQRACATWLDVLSIACCSFQAIHSLVRQKRIWYCSL